MRGRLLLPRFKLSQIPVERFNGTQSKVGYAFILNLAFLTEGDARIPFA